MYIMYVLRNRSYELVKCQLLRHEVFVYMPRVNMVSTLWHMYVLEPLSGLCLPGIFLVFLRIYSVSSTTSSSILMEHPPPTDDPYQCNRILRTSHPKSSTDWPFTNIAPIGNHGHIISFPQIYWLCQISTVNFLCKTFFLIFESRDLISSLGHWSSVTAYPKLRHILGLFDFMNSVCYSANVPTCSVLTFEFKIIKENNTAKYDKTHFFSKGVVFVVSKLIC